MANKKNPQKSAPKMSKGLMVSDKERAALRKSAEADMKRLGFKSVEELTAYYDTKRGY